ncbi:MAG: TIGR04255 family protein [Bryobacterales bacterium]|nr:TIGR04255 family protein [Bryobacterales bacterium]
MARIADSQRPRPDFTDPPVIEIALSVGFSPLSRYANAHSGLFSRRYAKTFKNVEEHPAYSIQPVGGSQETRPKIEIVDGPPPIRTWLITNDGSELLQMQRDVFAHNWRKTGSRQEYPRYESVRSRFQQYFQSFVEFIDEEDLGTIEANACEVTYVNHIPTGEHLQASGNLEELMTLWSWPHTTFLAKPREARFTAQFLIRDDNDKFIGHLNVDVKPAYRLSDNSEIVVLSLTARGMQFSDKIDELLSFFDLGREWIVRGFTDLTTPKMHKVWGRVR